MTGTKAFHKVSIEAVLQDCYHLRLSDAFSHSFKLPIP